MRLRDAVEDCLRRWDRYETQRGAPPVVDYDCAPVDTEPAPAESRLAVYRELTDLRDRAEGDADARLAGRLNAHLAYLRALMGERRPLDAYVWTTQGCGAAGWPEEHINAVGKLAQTCLDGLGIPWDEHTKQRLDELEGLLDITAAGDAIRQAAEQFEPAVRQLTGANGAFELRIEIDDVDAYWSYWLDGSGPNVRLRLNRRGTSFTPVRASQFALHEVLGHGLQSANIAARCTSEDVPWVRVLSVHAQHQVLLEGLAQALPLFILPDDEALIARVRVDHYLQLIRAELHIAINSGASIEDCVSYARDHVPYWRDQDIAGYLSDRSNDPLLRSYLWAYPAGFDWFVALAGADERVVHDVFHAAYREPLTPADLADLWPAGPRIGGPGRHVRLWDPAVS